MPRLFVLLVALAASLCLGVESARACTCAPSELRTLLAQSDAAFVGALIKRRPAPRPPPRFPSPVGDDIFTFRVERAVKGTLARTIEVWSSSSSASCGLEVRLGQRTGLFLSRSSSRWTSLRCWQVSPASLIGASRPLPRPYGRGPIRFLVGGAFGGVRVIALDGRGRPLGFGSGEQRARLLSVCPEARRAVEIAGPDDSLAVRSLRTLQVIREVNLPQGSSPSHLFCRDAGARDIYMLGSRGPSRIILHVHAGGLREMDVGKARTAAFLGGVVYLSDADRREITRLDLDSGTRSTIAASFSARELALTPGGTRLAAVSRGPDFAAERLAVFDLESADPAIRTAPLDASPWTGKLIWLSQSRLAFVRRNAPTLVFDRHLRQIGRLTAWRAIDSVVVSDVAYGITDSSLLSARLPTGPVRPLRGLPSDASVIAAVPGRVTVSPPRRAFCLSGA